MTVGVENSTVGLRPKRPTTPLKTPVAHALCIDTHVDGGPTPRRVSAQHARVRAPRGVFKTFGGPAGPCQLPYGRGSVTRECYRTASGKRPVGAVSQKRKRLAAKLDTEGWGWSKTGGAVAAGFLDYGQLLGCHGAPDHGHVAGPGQEFGGLARNGGSGSIALRQRLPNLAHGSGIFGDQQFGPDLVASQ